MEETDKLRQDTIDEFANLRRSISKEMGDLRKENTRLKNENIGLINLVNGHAKLINANKTGLKDLERNLRNELNRIATSFKNVSNAIKKKG